MKEREENRERRRRNNHHRTSLKSQQNQCKDSMNGRWRKKKRGSMVKEVRHPHNSHIDEINRKNHSKFSLSLSLKDANFSLSLSLCVSINGVRLYCSFLFFSLWKFASPVRRREEGRKEGGERESWACLGIVENVAVWFLFKAYLWNHGRVNS